MKTTKAALEHMLSSRDSERGSDSSRDSDSGSSRDSDSDSDSNIDSNKTKVDAIINIGTETSELFNKTKIKISNKPKTINIIKISRNMK